MISDAPLVSVITPCYNGEKWIGRLMDSVLDQTYPKIEFIIVNDGSTDYSENIILSYERKFQKRGYDFKYIYQENKGLGGAINTGLKVFKGDFFCWPDADDYLERDSIEKRVNVLLEHPEYAVVTSNAYVRTAKDLGEYRLLVNDRNRKYVEDPDAFSNLLKGKGVFCSGCHMIRTTMFLDVNPEREIYEARRGQNWQILLPVYFKYKRFYLDIPLYNYIDNPGSMSKDQNSLESQCFRMDEHEDVILQTLSMIEKNQNTNLQQTKDEVSERYLVKKMEIALEFGDRKAYSRLFELKQHYSVNRKEKCIFALTKSKILFNGYIVARRFLRSRYK